LLGLPIPATHETARPGWLRRWAFYVLVYGLVGALTITCYFIGYQRPEIAPPSTSVFQVSLITRFVIVWLGAVLKSASVDASTAGGVISFVLAAALFLSAVFLWRNRTLWRRYYPWALLAGFTLAAGIASAIGRAGLGLEALIYESPEGFSSYRYKITAVFGYIAAIGLLYRLYRDWARPHPVWQRRFLIGATVLTTLFGVAELFIYSTQPHRLNALQENRRRARTAVVWAETLPQNPELFHAYPYPKTFSSVVAEMKRAGLLKLPLIGDGLKRAISLAPPSGDPGTGSIAGGVVADNHLLRVEGWATIPAENARADYVVVGWISDGDSFRPFTAMPTGRRRPDVSKRASSAIRNAGFLQEVDISALPPSPLTVRAWSVDLKNQRVFPIAGSVRIERKPEP
ncbi:MAG TPA: hypothetical protein VJS88_07830, partial [Chthoniobacterales bacterium]|nr:hypothetical protein [Chthoniobacterales bacterium]